ncbi:MAG: hypothetical protein AABX07_06450 [Nanoarchaeota archaeon]
MPSDKSLKVLLWIAAVYHIVLGLLGVFAKDATVYLANVAFNFNLTLNNEMLWVINPFAAYLLVFGVFMAVAATDPKKYKNIIYAGVGLFALRVIQRIIFVVSAPEGLISSVDPIRNTFAIAVVAVMGLSMFLLARKLK